MTPERWNRVGIGMSLAALAAFVAMGGFILSTLPANWHVVTRYSDIPEQVNEGITGLESEIERLNGEIDFCRKELSEAEARCRTRAADARAGIVKSGESLDDARRERLLNEEAPRWDRAAAAARQAIDRVQAR